MAVEHSHPRRKIRVRRRAVESAEGRESPDVRRNADPMAVPKSGRAARGEKSSSRALALRPPEISLNVTTNRYGSIKRRSLRELMDQVDRMDADPMDLIPEATLMRALIIDYVQEYDALKRALLEWHAYMQGLGPRRGPPAKIPELKDVQQLIEGVGKLIARQHQIRQTGTISLAVFRRATELMGQVVSTYVKDQDTLSKIEQAWGHIALDPKSRPAESVVDAEVVSEENPHVDA